MLALISSIIASIQLNLAIIDIQENYKRRLNLSRLLSTTTSTFTRVKKSIAHARSVYDIVLCVYELFRVDG